MNVVRGVIGVVILGLIAFLCSNNRKGIRYRPVLCSLAVQVIFAFLVLRNRTRGVWSGSCRAGGA